MARGKVVAPSDVVALAHAAKSAESFERGVLDLLQDAAGFDLAFIFHTSPRHPMTLLGLEAARGHAGLETPSFAARVAGGRPSYSAELAPVLHAACAVRGVAIDTEVLGQAATRECAYHRDLVAPLGGKHSLLAYVRLRGQATGVIVLGRTGNRFRDREREAVEALLPTISLGLASYDRSDAWAMRGLTPREREVVRYLCLGYTNREIAVACGTSANTVRNQLASIFAKLGATTRSEAVGIVAGISAP